MEFTILWANQLPISYCDVKLMSIMCGYIVLKLKTFMQTHGSLFSPQFHKPQKHFLHGHHSEPQVPSDSFLPITSHTICTKVSGLHPSVCCPSPPRGGAGLDHLSTGISRWPPVFLATVPVLLTRFEFIH